MLQGHIKLSDSPIAQSVDWDWGEDGLQQQWNLGVPLLRIPLEIVAKKIFGLIGFPDRLLFLLIYALAMIELYIAFSSHSKKSTPEDRNPTLDLLAVVFSVMSPAFLRLVAVRFEVYEEVVAYFVLFQFILIARLLIFSVKQTPKNLLVVAFVASFLPLIRPTGIFPSLIAFALALAIFLRSRQRKLWAALATIVFISGPAILLTLNFFRFGAPTEFGHALSISMVPANDFAIRFDFPFQDESLLSAVTELFGFIFFPLHLNDWHYYESGISLFQSMTPRFRENYFQTISPLYLGLLLIFAISILVRSIPLKRTSDHGLRSDCRSSIMLAWSIPTALSLVVFYLRTPAISSRYILDLLPSCTILLTALWYLDIQKFTQRRGEKWGKAWGYSSALLIFGISSFDFSLSRNSLNQTHKNESALSADDVAKKLTEFRLFNIAATMVAKPLPESYECGDDFKRFGIYVNGQDWAPAPMCTPEIATVLFFKRAKCYKLTVEPIQDGPSSKEDWAKKVRIRENVKRLELISVELNGGDTELTFCSNGVPTTSSSNSIRMLTIGWTTKEIFKNEGPYPKPWVKLMKVARVE